jgi:hypothetical protein
MWEKIKPLLHPNQDIGADHPVHIVKSLKAFYGYLEPEPPGEICPRTMDLGVRVSTGLTGGLRRECGKSFGKCSKTMWTMKITP